MIPKKVKISGHIVQIEVTKDRVKYHGTDSSGCAALMQNKIFIEANNNIQFQHEVLMHEILEHINYQYQIEMPHDKLTTLSQALYQVMKDNKLKFD